MISLIWILFTALVTLAFFFLAPPWHPRKIPSVPFWVTLLPLFFETDQQQIFHQYIAGPLYEHGAIKIFFGGQWNVIVQRPAYISEIFRKENIYNKSGNQKKIPHSVLAEFLGSNIISARDAEWRRYRTVIKPGLQSSFNAEPILDNAKILSNIFCQLQEESPGKGIPVQEVLQRFSSANLLHSIFNCSELSVSEKQGLQSTFSLSCPFSCNILKENWAPQSQMMRINHEVSLHTVQTALKQYLFHPIFMSFPILDRLASVISSRSKARQLIRVFSNLLQSEILNGHARDAEKQEEHFLGGRLYSAWRDGTLTSKEIRDNLNVLYVAGQENPQLLMISSLYLLGKYQIVQEKLRQEIQDSGISGTSSIDWQHLPYLSATILECLRLFPPISQLINRRVAEPVWLGGHIYLPKGTYIGYNSYATNRDPGAWGSDADEFLPERWGSTDEQISQKYRSAKARAEFISFHGGSRACLGEKFALLEMRSTLFILVTTLRWELDPEWKDRMTPAGPLHPRGVRLIFEKL